MHEPFLAIGRGVRDVARASQVGNTARRCLQPGGALRRGGASPSHAAAVTDIVKDIRAAGAVCALALQLAAEAGLGV